MTAPLTPHEQPSQGDPSHGRPEPDPRAAAGEPGHGLPSPTPYPGHPAHAVPEGPGLRAEVIQAALVTVALVVSGVILGLLWLWLAPRVPMISDGKKGFPLDPEGEQAIGIDGWFVLLGLACGAVSAAVVFLIRKQGGVPLVVALAAGGLLASVVAWRLGVWLGPSTDVVAHAKSVGRAGKFDGPLGLGTKGALLAWPVAAMVVHLGLTAMFGPRDPEPGMRVSGPPR